MKAEQRIWTEGQGWSPSSSYLDQAQLVLAFGATAVIQDGNRVEEIRKTYPAAFVLGCSTSGEICGTRVLDDSLVVTAVHFQATNLKSAAIPLTDSKDSFAAGRRLARLIDHDGLVHVLILSEGLAVNGSELVRGLVESLPHEVGVTGGLSGDGTRFQKTLVLTGSTSATGTVAILGFYGSSLKVGYGSMGGWDSFGPERLITRSEGNVLYELDGQSALQLYRRYLGDHASGLPSSGLLFPLSVRTKESDRPVVRTILGTDEKTQSLTFAGNIPQGAFGQLMKANFERLIDGACGAAKTSCEAIGSAPPDLALLISCVGRKLVLKQRIEEELESVREILGQHTTMAGFYSYGEISPFSRNARCELHNQTMTITTFSER